jgi:hypothetical protein
MTIRAIEIHFGQPVELSREQEKRLLDLADEICKAYEASHPARVMWPSGYGCKPTYIPMTQEEEQERGMEFDESVLEIDCFEREDYAWKCAKCGQPQGDHKTCIVDPPAGDCDFTAANG